MKKRRVLSILIIAIIFTITSCLLLTRYRVNKYQINEKIKLYKLQSAQIDDIKITLVSISDSTCPKDTHCIWEGEYLYSLKVNNSKITLGTITKRSFLYKEYKISLLNDTTTKYIKFKVENKDNN